MNNEIKEILIQFNDFRNITERIKEFTSSITVSFYLLKDNITHYNKYFQNDNKLKQEIRIAKHLGLRDELRKVFGNNKKDL